MNIPNQMEIKINRSLILSRKQPFSELIRLILENPNFLPLGLIEFCGISFFDSLSIHLFDLFFKSASTSLTSKYPHSALIQAILRYDFRKKIEFGKKQEILEPQSISCKILVEYLKSVGSNYFKGMFGESLKMFFEKDVTINIEVWTNEFLSRIMDANTNKIPKDLMIVIEEIGRLCDQYELDSISYCLEFYFKIFLFPLMSFPVENGLLSGIDELSRIQSRNLDNVVFRITDIYQFKEATKFGKKMSFQLRSFFQDLLYSNKNDQEEDENEGNSKEVKIDPNKIKLDSYLPDTLTMIYHLVFTHAKRITDFYFKSTTKSKVLVKGDEVERFVMNALKFMSLIKKIGHSEKSGKELQFYIEKLQNNLIRNIIDQNYKISNRDFERKGLLYIVKSSDLQKMSSENCIMYIVIRRFATLYDEKKSETPFNYIGRIIFHIIKFMGNYIGKSFSLVLDGSLMNLTHYVESQKTVLDFFDHLIPLFPNITKIFDHLHRIFLLGCNENSGGGDENEKLMGDYIDHVKKNIGIRPQIFPLPKWKNLEKYVKSDTVVLPHETKCAQLRYYEVKSVIENEFHNMLITPLSIVVVHPLYKSLQNEYFFKDIEKIAKGKGEDDKFMMTITFAKTSEQKLFYCEYECYYEIFLTVNCLKTKVYGRNMFYDVSFIDEKVGERKLKKLMIINEGLIEIEKKSGATSDEVIKRDNIYLFSMLQDCILHDETTLIFKYINLRGKKKQKVFYVRANQYAKELFEMVDELCKRRKDLLLLKIKETVKMKNSKEKKN